MSLVPIITAKQYVQISHTREDAAFQILLDDAEEWVAAYCGVNFIENAGDEKIIEFLNGGGENLWLESPPMTTLTEVFDRNTLAIFPDTLIQNNLQRIWQFGVGTRKSGIWLPGIRRWRVTYDGGYTATTLPNALKKGILDMVYRSYHKRGGIIEEESRGMSTEWDDLLDGDMAKRLNLFSFRRPFG